MTGHLITRPAALAECCHCGAVTIIAMVDGLLTAADTQPLGISEEIAAIMAGKATFDLVITGQRIYLEWRSLTRIRVARDHPVVARHPCAAASSRPLPPVTAAAGEVPDEPPF